MSVRPVLVLFLLCASLVDRAAAQNDFDDEIPPGLVTRYAVGDKVVTRVDRDIAFDWGAASPDARLPMGRFSANWNGDVLVRQAGKYVLHAYVQGRVEVTVDGRKVLTGERNTPGWISGNDFDLGFGEKPLQVTFHKTQPNARLQLFWSSDKFSLEPIPAHLLFHEEADATVTSIERGRIAFAAHRCNRCHQRKIDAMSLAGPDLSHVAAGWTQGDALKRRIQSPKQTSSHSKMPDFGFNDDEATAIAAFLRRQSQAVALTSPKKSKDAKKDRALGATQFRALGCVACHTVGKLGHIGPFGGGDLTSVGSRRSKDWLFTWLKTPSKLNAAHRMPVFDLTTAERTQLATYLVGLTRSSGNVDNAPPQATDKVIEQGRKLVAAAHCASCHVIPKVKTPTTKLPDLAKLPADWSQTCLTEKPDRKKHRPAFAQLDRKAVIAYLASRAGALSAESEFTQGHRLVESNNCLACHDRDGVKGLSQFSATISTSDKELQGESQALIPPALTAVGDKLLDEALRTAVSGAQKSRRMPWLHVRMPRFKHTTEELSALRKYFIAHDRIPDDAPGRPVVKSPTESDALVAGHTLVGAKGFSCVACHQVGKFLPKNVALGTRGSDLMHLGKRMRKAYYMRWTRSPLRIVPGMEMPSYIKPVPGLLDERIDAQLVTIWDALNNPRFEPPTDPSAVEQLLAVRKGAPARIVRDVFTVAKQDGGGVAPRAMAIGFENGHGMLFDLNALAVRQWTFGDFARQRTQGKSWYWDMAGVPVMTGFSNNSDFALQQPGKAKLVVPVKRQGTSSHLGQYRRYGLGVVMEYNVFFDIVGKAVTMSVKETFTPYSGKQDGRTGWLRSIEFSNVPAGYKVLIRQPTARPSVGASTIVASDADGTLAWESLKDADGKTLDHFARIRGDDLDLLYAARLSQPDLALKTKPEKPPTVEKVTSLPGYDGVRLPISRSIMPTAMTWTHDGKLAFTSLKGHVYIAHDTNGDGLEDSLTLFEDGLAAPFGIIADGKDLIVAHKPELLRLRDTDGDGRADERTVIATGWGYNDNYHDWNTGIVRDSKGNLYIGLGSDYAQPKRPKEQRRWRGKVLRIGRDGRVEPVGHSFRYPVGLAIDARDRIVVSDNQGVQNTFNEINYLVPGRYYGVPSQDDLPLKVAHHPPAIQLPHPWSRSVNGLFFLPEDGERKAFGGHGIGCEYDSRFLVRFSLQEVSGVTQGAAYYFSRPGVGAVDENFLGPLCGAVSSSGDIYVGSIFDSGWLGGRNTGSIVRLRVGGDIPAGIRELKATPDGFEIDFTKPIDRKAAAVNSNYTISGYTRVWKGGYATADSGRHKANVTSAVVSRDGKTVRLRVGGLKAGHVYEVTCSRIGSDEKQDLWPATGHYTLHKIPTAK
jgi:mono/diheme cytochrome c family protein